MSYPFIRTTYGRRMGALALDWLACMSIVGALSGGLFAVDPLRPLWIFLLFFAQMWIFTALKGGTLGHHLFGMKVVRFEEGGPLSIGQALIRTILVMLVVTAVTFDENGRGIHERLSGSVLTRS